jgi:hypothetical protein
MESAASAVTLSKRWRHSIAGDEKERVADKAAS